MNDRGPSRYTHDIPVPPHDLSPLAMRQIDGIVDWWYDTDTLFGRANALLSVLGALGGLAWAVVSAVADGVTFGSVVLMPIFALFAGWLAGSLALTGAMVWLVWKGGVWAWGLLG